MEFSKLIETREWAALPPVIQTAMRHLIDSGGYTMSDLSNGIARYPNLPALLAEVVIADPRVARVLELRFGTGEKP